MIDPRFFRTPAPLSLAEIAALTGAVLARGEADAMISGVGPLDAARPTDLSFFDNPRYLDALAATEAGAVLVAARSAERVPADAAILVAADAAGAFRRVLVAFHPDALRPAPPFDPAATGIAPGAHVHPRARLESGVTIEPGAVVGAEVEIGSGSLVSATAVIGAHVAIGRDCVIGPGATLSHALLGNRVIVHPGVRIGQDGFGFQMGPRGHAKIPQIGRVIIQDDVEIGANATIDRGALRDTVIGEGTKIDNGVHVAHNVEIGRHCVIVAQVGISGSARLGDFVAIGGQAGVNGHVRVGDGAQIAATSAVQNDVPAGGRWGGVPAAPFKEWFREQTMMRKLARAALRRNKGGGEADRADADGGG